MLKTEKPKQVLTKRTRPKKVLLIHSGGTIGMGLPTPPVDRALAPDHSFVRCLRKNVPELWRLASLDIRTFSTKDSSQMTPEDWCSLHALISTHVDDYDAFVLTHGTDTMAYTGTALSYLLPFPCKPVVLTGSQRPLTEIRTDARRNLINSVAIAASQRICETSIFFDTVLLRANRAKKMHIEEFRAFDSPNFPLLAEERLKTLFNVPAREPLSRPRLEPRFDPRIQVVHAFPGAEATLAPKARGLVIEAFGCGNLPMTGSVLALLKSCRKKKVPVVLTSQVQSGALSPEIYELGRAALDLGAISAGDMTFEAALIKCMQLAGNDCPYDAWRGAISTNWAGELTPALT